MKSARKVQVLRYRILLIAICVSLSLACNRSDSEATQALRGAPQVSQWRLGFSAARDADFVEVLPQNDAVCNEAVDLRAEVPDDREVYVVPWSRAKTLQNFPQPLVWTLFRLDGNFTIRQLGSLAIIVKSDLNGCFYIGGGSSLPDLKQVNSITDQSLLLAVPGEQNQRMTIHLARDTSPKPAVETIMDLAEFKAVRAPKKVVEGRTVEANVAEKAETLWVLNYGYSDLSDGDNRWGVFRTINARLVPEYISPVLTYNVKNINASYRVTVVAAADIDGDGSDELILQKSYYEGTNYVILSRKNGVWAAVYESGVWR